MTKFMSEHSREGDWPGMGEERAYLYSVFGAIVACHQRAFVFPLAALKILYLDIESLETVQNQSTRFLILRHGFDLHAKRIFESPEHGSNAILKISQVSVLGLKQRTMLGGPIARDRKRVDVDRSVCLAAQYR